MQSSVTFKQNSERENYIGSNPNDSYKDDSKMKYRLDMERSLKENLSPQLLSTMDER